MQAAAGHAFGSGGFMASLRGFARPADRGQHTPFAIAAMHRLTEAWQLSRTEAAALIGASEAAWVGICCGSPDEPLSQDQLTRVSVMSAVFKALHTLFDDDTADRWLRLANNAPVFADRSPLQTMIDDGIPGMIEVGRYVDGLRSGT